MKRFFLLAVIFYLVFFINKKVGAQAIDCATQRCATCDLCGYCLNITPIPPAKNPPSNWESCRDCLYPSLGKIPATDNQTLKIDSLENAAPTPIPGSWYTMIGCINSNVGGFGTQGASGSVVQTLLNAMFGIVGGVAFLYVLYGAFLILTSHSDPEKLNHGKRVVFGAIAGVIFSLSAVFLVNIIGGKILKIPGLGE